MKKPPLLKLAVAAVEDLKALDVKVLDVRSLTTITDHMVICTGTSNRHVKSIADNVVVQSKKTGRQPRGVEGQQQGEWVLVDLGDVVVHVMQAQARAFYQLEKLWDMSEVKEKADSKAKSKASKDKRAASAPGIRHSRESGNPGGA